MDKSSIKNGFPEDSDIYIRCVHSKYGESRPLIRPQETRNFPNRIGGIEGYVTLQAIKKDDSGTTQPKDSRINAISCQTNDYEPICSYDDKNCIWEISARFRGNNSLMMNIIRLFGFYSRQTHVNVEIGPRA